MNHTILATVGILAAIISVLLAKPKVHTFSHGYDTDVSVYYIAIAKEILFRQDCHMYHGKGGELKVNP